MHAHPIVGNSPARPAAHNDTQLRKMATQLEASFLSEMLKATGLGSEPDSFGGGEGEDQFSSFLLSAQADAIAAAGGIGLADSIFQSLKDRQNG